jgi:2',3'-cyclic-nucleotide 2'-phosphodiesterase (5'-nucleotidase family)
MANTGHKFLLGQLLSPIKMLKLLAVVLLLTSCHKTLFISKTNYKQRLLVVDKNTKPDSAFLLQILPYKLKLDSQMNELIVQNEVELKKEQPEGSLGNFLADQLMAYAQLNLNPKPDFCLLNHGGLRLPAIYPGPVYLRTLFELQPFENQLTLVKIKGKDLAIIAKLVKEWGGAPVSGLRLVFQSGNLINATINGQAIQEDNDYWVLTSDYLANGGDYANVLKAINEKIFLPTKLRDALIVSLRAMAKNGQTIQTKKDGRIQFTQ